MDALSVATATESFFVVLSSANDTGRVGTNPNVEGKVARVATVKTPRAL
jgi:hypothetical protein